MELEHLVGHYLDSVGCKIHSWFVSFGIQIVIVCNPCWHFGGSVDILDSWLCLHLFLISFCWFHCCPAERWACNWRRVILLCGKCDCSAKMVRLVAKLTVRFCGYCFAFSCSLFRGHNKELYMKDLAIGFTLDAIFDSIWARISSLWITRLQHWLQPLWSALKYQDKH